MFRIPNQNKLLFEETVEISLYTKYLESGFSGLRRTMAIKLNFLRLFSGCAETGGEKEVGYFK